MGDMNGLPALSDPRLIYIQKQSRRIRKGTTIRNDKLKFHKDKYTKMVERDNASTNYRSWQRSMPIKNSLVEIRGLQKCLKKRRESSTLEPESTNRNGVYDGQTLDSMRNEVEKIIRDKNPRERRLRKVERIKSNGLMDGRIVDYKTSMDKFTDVVNRPKGLRRNMTMFDYIDEQSSGTPVSRTSSRTSTVGRSQEAESPAQLYLPPIQARRSTIANCSDSTTGARRRLFDMKSDRSDPASMKRSMSFAIAR